MKNTKNHIRIVRSTCPDVLTGNNNTITGISGAVASIPLSQKFANLRVYRPGDKLTDVEVDALIDANWRDFDFHVVTDREK